MPNDLGQDLRAEIFKQTKGVVQVVLDEKDADGILTGISEEKKGTGRRSPAATWGCTITRPAA